MGRPRSEAAEAAILEATARLLEEGVPLADLSIERIARTAGVGKATIYRHWNDKEDLFVDALRAAESAELRLPGTSMRDDLVALLESLRQRGLISRSSAISRNVYAQMSSSPKLWATYQAEVVAPRRDLGVQVLRRGQDNGELRTDVDPSVVVDMLVGPLLIRSFMRMDPDLPDALSEQIVDTALEGLRPVSSPEG
jgi:AcrR family transcriptional regulator